MDTFKNSVFVFIIGSVFLSHIHIMTWENKEVVQQAYETQIQKISFNESEQLVETEQSIQDKKAVSKNRQRMSSGKVIGMIIGIILGVATTLFIALGILYAYAMFIAC